MKPRNIFSSKNPPTSWERNPNHFLKNYDLSGVAVYVDLVGVGQDSSVKPKKSGVLISNKHVLFAQHIIGAGASNFDIKFVNNNNQVFTYTVTSVSAISDTDILIGVLNSVVDSSLCYYKVLPSNFQSYYDTVLDPVGSGLQMPVVYLDQDKNLSVGDAILKKFAAGSLPWIWTVYSSSNLNKYQYAEGLITNDSGNAIFAVLNNELIILGTWYSGSASGTRNASPAGTLLGTGLAVHEYISLVNTAMTTLAGTAYSLTQINPNFKSYSSLKIPSVTIGTNLYNKNVSSYNRSPDVKGYGQDGKTISLDDDGYAYGPYSLSSDLSYTINPSSPYLALTTNNLATKTNNGGISSSLSSNIAYKALDIPAPVLNSISNTTNKRPVISGSWTQAELPSYSEDIYIDIYLDNVIISSLGDVTLANVKSNLLFNFSYTPSSDLSVGSHTIKAKAYYFDNNYSSFSNSVTFTIIDSGGS